MVATSSNSIFYFNAEHLKKIADRFKNDYKTAAPYAHAVIDDFLPKEWVDPVARSLPVPGRVTEKHDAMTQKKTGYRGEALALLGPEARQLITELNSGIFIEFLERLTGIEGLVPDPHLNGGGVHQIRRGGFLKVHADFNWSEKLKLDRRVNLLLYLNPGWKEEYGGHLELWDEKMSKCEKKVLPIFNRLVIFNTNDHSFHGHPEPLTCPEDIARNSIAMYYYTNGRPKEERRFGRNTTTLYQERPGEKLYANPLRQKIKKLIPSWAFEVRNRLRGY